MEASKQVRQSQKTRPTSPSLARRLSARPEKRLQYGVDGIKKIGQIIRSARESKDLNLDDVVEKTGYNRSAIFMIETGKKTKAEDINTINVPLLTLLCEVLEPINPDTGKPFHPWELLSIAFCKNN